MSDGDRLKIRIRIGYRFSVVLSVPIADIRKGSAMTLEATWLPKMPTRLSSKELADYRRGRDALLAEVASILSGRVACVETGTGTVGLFDPTTSTGEASQ